MDNTSNPAPTSSPVVAQEPAKKKGGKTALIAIIALLVGGAIASGVFVAIKFLNNDPKNNQTANCDKNTIDNIEIEPIKDDDGNDVPDKGIILDARLTAELAYKTNRILANTPSSERTVAMDTTGDYKDYVNLSNDMKMKLVMTQIDGNSMVKKKVSDLPNGSDAKETYTKIGHPSDAEVGIVYIDDTVKSDYKYMFDDEPKTHPAIDADIQGTSCFLSWDTKQNYYYQATQCGGGSSVGHSSYQYKYLLEGDKAYVYLAIMGIQDDADSPTLYSGFITDNKVLNVPSDQKNSLVWNGAGGELFNSSTQSYEPIYKKLQHYRAVFEKGSDNDFYYKTLEKVND